MFVLRFGKSLVVSQSVPRSTLCVVLVERAILVSATCQDQLEEVHSHSAQRSTSERFNACFESRGFYDLVKQISGRKFLSYDKVLLTV